MSPVLYFPNSSPARIGSMVIYDEALQGGGGGHIATSASATLLGRCIHVPVAHRWLRQWGQGWAGGGTVGGDREA